VSLEEDAELFSPVLPIRGLESPSIPAGSLTRHFQEKTKPLGMQRGWGLVSPLSGNCNLHQGKIHIQSELGKGTTFT